MATGGEIQSSTDTMEVKTSPGCSPCSDDGSYSAAGHYCVDCGLYFCGRCVKCHNKIPASASHQVNAVANTNTALTTVDTTADIGPVSKPPESLKCAIHHDQSIDTYCKNHDEVCCGTCVIVKHRSCTTIEISIAAKDFKTSPELNEIKDELNSIITKLSEQKDRRTENQNSIEKEKQECIENVDRYEEEIIAKVKQLADNSRKLVRSKYERYNTALDREVSVIESVLSTIRTYFEKLETTDLEQLLFTIVKTNKYTLKVNKEVLENMVGDWEEKKIQFHIDETLGQALNELGNAFGKMKYKATFYQDVNIVTKEDTYSCEISDMCFINNGDICVADTYNGTLKRLSSDLQFKDAIDLPFEPVAVCEISEHEIAVRENNSETVHIVTVGNIMELTSSFELDDEGYGMTYDADTEEIYACDINKVTVYSKTGTKIRTYEKDANGEQIFSGCRQIALSEDKQDIYVTDHDKGLIVIDKNGTLKIKVVLSGDDYDGWVLCILPRNFCLVGTNKDGVLSQIDTHGEVLGNMIDRKDKPMVFRCAVYDREKERLVVGGDTDKLLIYDLPASK